MSIRVQIEKKHNARACVREREIDSNTGVEKLVLNNVRGYDLTNNFR